MSLQTFHVTIDGLRINVYDSSVKTRYMGEIALVFLHGFPGQISNWKYQIRYLEEKYRVIAYDQRGFGSSDKPRKVSFEDYLSDLDKVLSALKVKPENAIVIGHSFGGMVAQTYAWKSPVKGLVLIGSLTKIKPDIIDKIVWYLPSIFWKKLFYSDNPLTRRVYREMFFSPTTPQKVFEDFLNDNREYIESLSSHVFRYLKFFKDYDASKWLHEIRTPTLIIVGRDDKVTPPAESEKIKELIQDSELVVVEDAGHLILYEKPEYLNSLIEGFIRSLSSSA